MKCLKWIAFLLLLPSFGAIGAKPDMCAYVFRKNESKIYSPDLKTIEKINQLQEWSGRFRGWGVKDGDLAPYAKRKGTKIFGSIEQKLLMGKSDQAIATYKALYRKVEGSVLIIQRYEDLAAALRKAISLDKRNYSDFLESEGVIESLRINVGSKINAKEDAASSLEEVEKFLRKRYRVLGQEYQDYVYAGESFLKLASAKHCSKACEQAIERFHSSVGLRSDLDRELFRDYLGNIKSYSLEDIKATYRAHPESVLVGAKKEVLLEGFVVLKRYAKDLNLIGRLFKAMGNTKIAQTRSMVKLFISLFDKRYEDVDLLIMQRIAYSDLDAAAKSRLLEEQVAGVDIEKFLINFSRGVEGNIKKSWADILAHSKKKNKKLFTQMEKAAEIGAVLGPYGNTQVKGVKRFVVSVVFGAALVNYALFNVDESDHGGLEELPLDLTELDRNEGLSYHEDSSVDLKNSGKEVFIEYLSRQDEELTEGLAILLRMHEENQNSEGYVSP